MTHLFGKYAEFVRKNPSAVTSIENAAQFAMWMSTDPDGGPLHLLAGGNAGIGVLNTAHTLILQDAAQREAAGSLSTPISRTADDCIGITLLFVHQLQFFLEILSRRLMTKRRAWGTVVMIQLVKTILFLALKRSYLYRIALALRRTIAGGAKGSATTAAPRLKAIQHRRDEGTGADTTTTESSSVVLNHDDGMAGDSNGGEHRDDDDERRTATNTNADDAPAWIPRVSVHSRSDDALGSSVWDYAAAVLNLYYWARPLLLVSSAAQSQLTQMTNGEGQSLTPITQRTAPSSTVQPSWGFWGKWAVLDVLALAASLLVRRSQPAIVGVQERPSTDAAVLPFGYPQTHTESTITNETMTERSSSLLIHFLRDPFFGVALRDLCERAANCANLIPIVGGLLAHGIRYRLGLQSSSFLYTIGPPQ